RDYLWLNKSITIGDRRTIGRSRRERYYYGSVRDHPLCRFPVHSDDVCNGRPGSKVSVARSSSGQGGGLSEVRKRGRVVNVPHQILSIDLQNRAGVRLCP